MKNQGLIILIICFALSQVATTYVLKEGGVELARWTEEDGSDAVEVINADEGLEGAEEPETQQVEEAMAFEETPEEMTEKSFDASFFEEPKIMEVEAKTKESFDDSLFEEPEIMERVAGTEESSEDIANFYEEKNEMTFEEVIPEPAGKEVVEEMEMWEKMLLEKGPSEPVVETPEIEEKITEELTTWPKEEVEEVEEVKDSWDPKPFIVEEKVETKNRWESSFLEKAPKKKVEPKTTVRKSNTPSWPARVAKSYDANGDGVIWEGEGSNTPKREPSYLSSSSKAMEYKAAEVEEIKPKKKRFSFFSNFSKPKKTATPKNKEPMRAAATGFTSGPDQDWGEGLAGYEQAVQLQNKTGQPILIYFYTNQCARCKRFDRDILSKNKTEEFLSALPKVKVNIKENPSLYQKYRLKTYPVFLVQQRTGRTVSVYEQSIPDFFIQEVKKALV